MERNSAAGGFPFWDLQNYELKETENNRDSRGFFSI